MRLEGSGGSAGAAQVIQQHCAACRSRYHQRVVPRDTQPLHHCACLPGCRLILHRNLEDTIKYSDHNVAVSVVGIALACKGGTLLHV